MKNLKPDSDSPTYVTRDELDALTKVVGVALARVQLAHTRSGYADGNVATQLEMAARAPDLPAAERAALKSVIKAFDSAINRQRSEEFRQDHDRGNAFHRISG